MYRGDNMLNFDDIEKIIGMLDIQLMRVDEDKFKRLAVISAMRNYLYLYKE